MNMAKEDEEEYLNFCSEAMFRIHILELRLNRYARDLSWLQYHKMYGRYQNNNIFSD